MFTIFMLFCQQEAKKMGDLLSVAAIYFLGAFERYHGQLTVHNIPGAHILALGSALYLTVDVTEEQSKLVTGRGDWEKIYRNAQYIFTWRFSNLNLDRKLDELTLVCSGQVIDHALKAYTRPSTSKLAVR